MTRLNDLKTTAALAALMAAALSGPAAAQQDDPDPAPEADDLAKLEEIVITAQRRAQSLQSVPIAVSAFTELELERRNVQEILDIVDFVPNLTGHVNTGLGSANTYFLRGFGNTESIATFDPPVASYVDDVLIARQNANNYALFGVERVEVLRGPQGILFGRNTTGGAINIITAKPKPDFGAEAEIGYGRFDRFEGRASVNVPISDRLQTRLAGYYFEDDGYVDNITTGETLNDETSFGVRGQIRFLPTERITWDLSADYVFRDRINIASRDPEPILAPNGFPVTATEDSTVPRETATGIREGDCDGDLLEDLIVRNEGLCDEVQSVSITNTIQADFDSLSVTSITGYRDIQQDFQIDLFNGILDLPTSPVGGFSLANRGDHEQVSQEVKANGRLFDDRFNYTVGAYYLHEDNVTDFADVLGVFQLIGLSPINLDRTLENTTESWAIYFQGEYEVLPRLTLIFGARFTDEEKEIAFSNNGGIPGFPALNGFNTEDIIAAGIPTTLDEQEFSPKFGIEYQATDDIFLFATATNGFKSGGWNARGANAAEIQPFEKEEVWSYEAGVKSELFDRLRLNLTGFWVETACDNLDELTPENPNEPGCLQVISAVAVDRDGDGNPDANPAFLTQNAADFRSFGAELDAEFVVNDYVSVYAALGLLDADYLATSPGAQTAGIETSDDPVRTPGVTLAFGGNVSYPLGNWGNLFANASGSYANSFNVSTNNEQPIAETGNYFIVNASIGAETADGRWRLTAECTNCGDETYVNSWLFYVYHNEPPRWLVKLRWRY